jgi:rod shape-determining protein MreC
VFKLRRKKLIRPLIIICCVFLLASFIPFLRPLTLNILRFPLKIVSAIGREIRGIVFYHRNYVQNDVLKDQADFLKNKLNAARELQAENARLKNLLKLKERPAYKTIAANVIARSPDNWAALIVIDKGSFHGLSRGMAVTNYLGLVGRIAEVSRYESKVILINSPDLSVSALCQRSRQEGLVSGTLGGSLIMRYLPKDADIRPADIIITSGLTEVYPKGLVIGTVTDVGEEFSGLSHYAVIKPAANLSSIEEVLIVIQ